MLLRLLVSTVLVSWPNNKKQMAGPYNPLFVPSYPWQDVSLNFILGIPKMQKKKIGLYPSSG